MWMRLVKVIQGLVKSVFLGVFLKKCENEETVFEIVEDWLIQGKKFFGVL